MRLKKANGKKLMRRISWSDNQCLLLLIALSWIWTSHAHRIHILSNSIVTRVQLDQMWGLYCEIITCKNKIRLLTKSESLRRTKKKRKGRPKTMKILIWRSTLLIMSQWTQEAYWGLTGATKVKSKSSRDHQDVWTSAKFHLLSQPPPSASS